MVWHSKPVSIPDFPNDTAQDWAAEWFTPIDATHLNYLKDNLEFMLNPPAKLNLASTPGTVFTATNPSPNDVTLLTGTLPNYSGSGMLLINIALEIQSTIAAPNGAELFLKFDNGSSVRYLPRASGLTSSISPVLKHVIQNAGNTYIPVPKLVVADNSTSITGTNTVTLFLRATSTGSVTARNVRLNIREL